MAYSHALHNLPNALIFNWFENNVVFEKVNIEDEKHANARNKNSKSVIFVFHFFEKSKKLNVAKCSIVDFNTECKL